MAEHTTPNRTAFIRRRLYSQVLPLALIILGVAFFISSRTPNPLLPLALVALLVLLMGYMYASARVSYRKEHYSFGDDRIVIHEGSILSDHKTELLIKNITHVKLILPLIEHWRYATGHVYVQSAGSGGTEAYLQSVDDPWRMYQYMRELMHGAGFRLTREEMVQQESPDSKGVILDIASKILSFSVAILGVAGGTFAFLSRYPALSLIALALFIILGSLYIIFHYKDLKNRVYSVYSDTVVYEEGFLTKHYAFIPMENVADSFTTQNFLDKLLGLFEVRISPQGSGQSIAFKNMNNGKRMEENLDRLISTFSRPGSQEKKADKKTSTPKTAQKKSRKKTEVAEPHEYKMDGMRTLLVPLVWLPVVLLLFPLLLVYVPFMIKRAIDVAVRRFIVKAHGVEERYEFLSTTNREFSIDKLTQVVFKESFIDKWFGTCSVTFSSIGSSADIVFRHVKKDTRLMEFITSTLGFTHEDEWARIQSEFHIANIVRRSLGLSAFVSVACLALLVAGFFIPPLWGLLVVLILLCAGVVWYQSHFYASARIIFYDSFLRFERGLLIRRITYASYENIKDVQTTCYAAVSYGSLTCNVAGERVIQGQHGEAVQSNGFTLHHISRVERKAAFLDWMLAHGESKEEAYKRIQQEADINSKQLFAVQPSAKNVIYPLVLVSVIIVPAVVHLPFTVPLLLVSYRCTQYEVLNDRVLARWGIVYKSRKTILFGKIDHINTTVGALNKLFKNGSVTVNTVGSSQPEMTVGDIPHYKKFYEILNQHYR